MSILALGANRIPGLSKSSLLGISIFIYLILTVIPALVIADAILYESNLLNVSIFMGLLAVSIYGVASRIRKGDNFVTS